MRIGEGGHQTCWCSTGDSAGTTLSSLPLSTDQIPPAVHQLSPTVRPRGTERCRPCPAPAQGHIAIRQTRPDPSSLAPEVSSQPSQQPGQGPATPLLLRPRLSSGATWTAFSGFCAVLPLQPLPSSSQPYGFVQGPHVLQSCPALEFSPTSQPKSSCRCQLLPCCSGLGCKDLLSARAEDE